MKKFFTLIAAVAMAASVNAQGLFAIQEGDTYKAGDQVTSVENVTLTFNENAGTTFNAGKKTVNWADADFVAYVSGKNNGKLVSGSEPTGCVYKFETKKAGTLTVAVQLNASKGFYVFDEDLSPVDYTYNMPDAADAESQTFTQNEKGENILETKSNGTITIAASASSTYYVLAAGTKLGFFGFKFAAGTPTGITNVNAAVAADAPVYNLAGQKVAASYKGIVIKNGKKFLNK